MEHLLSPAVWRDFLAQLLLFMPKLATSLIILLLFWVVGTTLERVVRQIGQRRQVDKDVLNLLAQATLITIMTFGVVTALGTLGIDITALVAGLGLTGFALGFALKDIISNFLAGILILTYHPFQRGDRITVAGSEGIVSQIDLRYTILKNDNQTILIPNSQLFTNTINLIHPPSEETPANSQKDGVAVTVA